VWQPNQDGWDMTVICERLSSDSTPCSLTHGERPLALAVFSLFARFYIQSEYSLFMSDIAFTTFAFSLS
jgi:hypothetical protein